MKALDAIRWVDEKKHNVFPMEDKLRWLFQAEQMVRELESRHGRRKELSFPEPDTELLAPAPYDQLYLRWLEAQIDYTNQEYLKYNNAMALFNTLWGEYAGKLSRECLQGTGEYNLF